MTKRISTFSVLLIALVAFCLGAVTAISRGWGSGLVSAKIVNKSDQTLRSYTLRYKTCGAQSSLAGVDLHPGESRVVRYAVCGEGGYQIEAQFSDGRVLKSTEGYVESGYSSTETISLNNIISDQRIYAF